MRFQPEFERYSIRNMTTKVTLALLAVCVLMGLALARPDYGSSIHADHGRDRGTDGSAIHADHGRDRGTDGSAIHADHGRDPALNRPAVQLDPGFSQPIRQQPNRPHY